MKKETAAAILLAALLLAALANIHFICKLTGELTELSELAGDAAAREDWESANRYAQKAVALWSDKDGYTHVVLRHGEIDAVSDALYDMLSEISARSSGAAEAAAQRAVYHLDSLSGMERIRLGSLF